MEADPAVSRVTTQLGMTVKRSYVARRITLLAVAAMAAVAAATVLSATAQNQAPPPRHQLRVERTARQVSAAGASATAIAITPNGRTAYVVNNVGNTVTPITLATGKPGHPIKVGRSPNKIVITPNGKTAYVIDSREASDNVTPINLVTNKPEPRLKVSKANAIAIAPRGGTAWVHSGSGTKLVPIRIG